MPKKTQPVYTKFTSDMLETVIGLILTLQRETRPIANHSDPGAVQDCWNSLMEIESLVAKKARQAVELENQLDSCIKIGKWELANMAKESITSKLLVTGRMSAYNFVLTWFREPGSGRQYAVKFEPLGNDLFWTFVTPDDFQTIQWTGYNDSNWWINVTPIIGQMQRKDIRGRVWELDPKQNIVTLIKDADRAG